ncbi:MAG: TetR/AcrR family transcriptional regulator [Calothrix sp. SM1_7_51]|nr:TetR/AcrR family transcriptional regulator [Calothrix sp. SM1_7_51]
MTSGQLNLGIKSKSKIIMQSYQRARQPEQKQERCQAILDAALQLWLESSYTEFTMARLAERIGLAKGTIYVYFATKEHLFLTLLEKMAISWLEDLHRQLLPYSGKNDIKEVARLLCSSFTSREPFTRLLCLLESVLERGIDYKTALRFKQKLLEGSILTGKVLEECLPDLQSGDGVKLLVQIRALLTGLRQMSDSAPVLQQVIKDHTELELYRVQFERDLEIGLLALIQGFVILRTN